MIEELQHLRVVNAELLGLLAADPAAPAAALEAAAREVAALRVILADVHTALIAAGWHDDELIARVRASKMPPPTASRTAG